MRRFAAAASCVVALAGLSGCGSSSEVNSSSPSTITISHDGRDIQGHLRVPESTGQASASSTLVILSHGFGGTYRDVDRYAQYFTEQGMATFDFDFYGGGSGNASGGQTTDMSVLTEAADLNAVVDYFRSGRQRGLNISKLILFGQSQGGFVSTYVAANRPSDVDSLVLVFPAFVIQDDSRQRNPSPESGPETSSLMGVQIGRQYDVDAQSFDIYSLMPRYTGPVFIAHGTADSIVPIRYSERARSTFPDARLVQVDGAGHGFYGDDFQNVSAQALRFMQERL